MHDFAAERIAKSLKLGHCLVNMIFNTKKEGLDSVNKTKPYDQEKNRVY